MNKKACPFNRRQFLQTTTLASMAISLPSVLSYAATPKILMYKNLSGGHIGLNANQKESLDLAKQYGFNGVAPSLGELDKMSESQRQEIIDLLREKQLQWGTNGLSVEFRQDEDTFKKGLANLPHEAQLMREMGITRVATWLLPGSNNLTYMEHFEQLRKRLRECAVILKDNGIRLGLEFVGPRTTRRIFRYAFACTQREMLELCQAIDTGNVGLLLDSWHWYTSHGTPDELAQLTNDQIVHVHVNDAPKDIPIDEQMDSKRELPCTTGVIDMKIFINALYKIGYDGPVECEPFDDALRKMDTEAKLQKTIEALDRTFALIEI